MEISFSDIEDAFIFVSTDQPETHSAYLCKKTGEIIYVSETGDSDELPEDIDQSDQYVCIPHKNDLGLGKPVVIEFTSNYMPEELDRVYLIFRNKGAYARYKDLLEKKELLAEWYSYENERLNEALKEWCTDNHIEIKD